MPTRILFITKASGYGGTEKHLIELIRRLDLSSFEPIIICLDTDPYTERLVDQHHLPLQVIDDYEPRSAFGYWFLFRKWVPAIIVFDNGGFNMFPWYAFAAAHIAGTKRVYSIEHFFAGDGPSTITSGTLIGRVRRTIGRRARQRWRVIACARFIDKAICVSDAVRKRLISHWGYSAQKTVTIRNGVDPIQYRVDLNSTNLVSRSLGLKFGGDVLLCVARLATEKGVEVLVDALSLLSRRGLSLRCMIVGDGPNREKLLIRARDAGIREQVTFLGYQEDVRPYYWLATIFILPSYWEGLSLTLLEAMASGLPCIATDVGGNAEVVVPDVTGLLVKPGSSDELAGAIEYLVRNRDERERMGREGRKRVCEHFDLATSMSKLLSTLVE